MKYLPAVRPESNTETEDHMQIGKNGRYEVEARIGSGATGNVYKVWDKRYHRELAAKCFTDGSAAGREKKILTHGKAGTTPFYYDDFKSHFGDVIVMELVEGTSLASYIRKMGPGDYKKVYPWGLELSDILMELHRAPGRILYRDLKPENIILGDNGHLRLVDFGTAELVAEEKITAVCGTRDYAAPEQWMGKGSTVRSDIYSLGVCLYECMTGYREVSVYDDRIPLPLYRVLRICTEKQPQKRYFSASEFKKAWMDAYLRCG